MAEEIREQPQQDGNGRTPEFLRTGGIPDSIPVEVVVRIPPELSRPQRESMYRALQRIARWRDQAWVIRQQHTETQVASRIIGQMDFAISALKNHVGFHYEEIGPLLSKWSEILKELNEVARQVWDKAREAGVLRRNADYRDPIEAQERIIERRKGPEVASETNPEKRARDMEEIATRAVEAEQEKTAQLS